MKKVLYTAEAHIKGGRADGRGRSSDGMLEVDLRLPTDMGGDGNGTNPEQLFAIGFAACFEGAIGVAMRRRKADPCEVAIDSKVALITEGEHSFGIDAELHVVLTGIDPEEAAEIVREAHQICPYSNATRGNVDVRLSANGMAVAA